MRAGPSFVDPLTGHWNVLASGLLAVDDRDASDSDPSTTIVEFEF